MLKFPFPEDDKSCIYCCAYFTELLIAEYYAWRYLLKKRRCQKLEGLNADLEQRKNQLRDGVVLRKNYFFKKGGKGEWWHGDFLS